MKKHLTRENAFLGICLIFAVVFGWGFFSKAGFPPTRVAANWQLLLVFMVFIILPFAKKVDFFQFLSFEAKIDEVRREVSDAKQKVTDVRDDVRHVISQQNTLSASIQSINNHASTVNIYDRPGREELDAAKKSLSDVEPSDDTPTDQLSGPLTDEKLFKVIFGEDYTSTDPVQSSGAKIAEFYSDIDGFNLLRKIKLSEHVAILRIRIERELRRLTKNLLTYSSSVRHQSIRPITTMAMKYYPDHLSDQFESFNVFFRIANAAVHAEDVPLEDLETAIFLGERLLSLLQSIDAITGFKDDQM